MSDIASINEIGANREPRQSAAISTVRAAPIWTAAATSDVAVPIEQTHVPPLSQILSGHA
jgi:hypothetical protein